MARLVFDVDHTLCVTKAGDYAHATPREDVLKKLRELNADGHEIILYTSRNVSTYAGNLGKINVHTLPILIRWLEAHQVPFNEIYMGKPWCGTDGFYVDDRAIRPSELVALSLQEIDDLLSREMP